MARFARDGGHRPAGRDRLLSRRPSMGLAVVLVLALIASCTSDPKAAGVSATARDGAATTLNQNGVTLSIPDGGLADGDKATLSVTKDPSPSGVPDVIRLLGPEAAVTIPGTLGEPATITFPAPAELSAGVLEPVVVWEDPAGGWQWLPTTWAPGDTVVTATTDHFSGGFLGGIDVKKIAGNALSSFKNYITGRSGVAQPSCGDEAGARADGVTVDSGRGDRVKWCLGIEDGQRVLKVANNTRMFMQMAYPSSWTVKAGLAISISTSAVARMIGAAVPTRPGTESRIVDGGDTLTFVVPPGSSGRVSTEVSFVAWAVSALFFAADVYTLVAGIAGSAIKKSANAAVDRLKRLMLEGDTGDVALDAMWSCAHDIRDLTDAGSEAFADVAKFIATCVPAALQAYTTGLGLIASIVLSAVVGVVGLVLTAVNLLVTAVREVYDSLASLGGNSDVFYDILIRFPLNDQQLLNSALPAAVCGGPGWGWDQPQPIQLANGAGEARAPSGEFGGASVTESSVLGILDLNGDGALDGLLMATCIGSPIADCCAGRSSHMTVVLPLATSPTGELVLIGSVLRAGETSPCDKYGAGARDIRGATLDGATVVATEALYYPENCTLLVQYAPAAEVTVRYELRAGEWAQTGFEFPEPARIRFDGIGDASLRWTASDLVARGYTNRGNLYQGMSAACVRYAKDGAQTSFSVESSTGRVLAIRNLSRDPALRTQVGSIGLGSTLADIRAAFPGYRVIEKFARDFGQGSDGVIIETADGAIAFGLTASSPADFASGTAVVSSLPGVGLPGQAPTASESGC